MPSAASFAAAPTSFLQLLIYDRAGRKPDPKAEVPKGGVTDLFWDVKGMQGLVLLCLLGVDKIDFMLFDLLICAWGRVGWRDNGGEEPDNDED